MKLKRNLDSSLETWGNWSVVHLLVLSCPFETSLTWTTTERTRNCGYCWKRRKKSTKTLKSLGEWLLLGRTENWPDCEIHLTASWITLLLTPNCLAISLSEVPDCSAPRLRQVNHSDHAWPSLDNKSLQSRPAKLLVLTFSVNKFFSTDLYQKTAESYRVTMAVLTSRFLRASLKLAVKSVHEKSVLSFDLFFFLVFCKNEMKSFKYLLLSFHIYIYRHK